MSIVPNARSWRRLKTLLRRLRPGDVITAHDAIEETRLSPVTIDLVLAALTRAELFTRVGERFVRRAAIEPPQRCAPR